MEYSQQIWNQLKNLTADQIIKALEKSGWERDQGARNFYVYLHPDKRRITIHYHPRKTYGPKLLKALLDIINWSEEELRKLKLIK